MTPPCNPTMERRFRAACPTCGWHSEWTDDEDRAIAESLSHFAGGWTHVPDQ